MIRPLLKCPSVHGQPALWTLRNILRTQLSLYSTVRTQERNHLPKRPRTFDTTSHRNKPAALPLLAQPKAPSKATTPTRDWNKKNLIGLTLESIQETIKDIPGVKSYTALQIFRFLYQRGVTSIDEMLNIPMSVKDELKEHYTIDYGRVVVNYLRFFFLRGDKAQEVVWRLTFLFISIEHRDQTDHVSPLDGTRKLLVGFEDPKAMVESVFIPMNGPRGTQCISSQVGCSLACTFCHTGTQKLLRNLTAGEIIGQYMIPAKDYGDLPLVKNVQRNVNNIVFMGQGEPLYNWRYEFLILLSESKGLQGYSCLYE